MITPEISAAEVPASVDRRVGAYAIDLGIALAIPLLLVSMLSGAAFSLAAMAGTTVTSAAPFVPALLLVSCVGWAVAYTAMQGGAGSIGQRLLGIRISDADSGDHIGFARALARNVLFALAASIVVGLFSPLLDRSARHQGWHDLAARAGVVDVRATAAAASAHRTSTVAPVAAPAYGARVNSAPIRASAAVDPGDPVDEDTVLVSQPTVAAEHVVAPVPTGSPRDSGGLAVATREPLPAGERATTSAAASEPLVDQQAQAVSDHLALAVLTWDDGSRTAVYERTVCGRNPVREPGAVALALRDETLSLSKTHFEVGGDPRAPWIIDRFSTNGTMITRDGERIPVVAGVPTSLRPGDRLEFGDRAAVVGVAA